MQVRKIVNVISRDSAVKQLKLFYVTLACHIQPMATQTCLCIVHFLLKDRFTSQQRAQSFQCFVHFFTCPAHLLAVMNYLNLLPGASCSYLLVLSFPYLTSITGIVCGWSQRECIRMSVVKETSKLGRRVGITMSACPGQVLTCRELDGLLIFSQQEKLLFVMCKSLQKMLFQSQMMRSRGQYIDNLII